MADRGVDTVVLVGWDRSRDGAAALERAVGEVRDSGGRLVVAACWRFDWLPAMQEDPASAAAVHDAAARAHRSAAQIAVQRLQTELSISVEFVVVENGELPAELEELLPLAERAFWATSCLSARAARQLLDSGTPLQILHRGLTWSSPRNPVRRPVPAS